MIEIGIHQVIKNFGFKQVLKGVDLEVMTGQRVALVGKNGSGKTTILKMVAGLEYPDQGAVSVRRGAVIGYLEQIPDTQGGEVTVWHVLMAAFDALHALEADMRDMERRISEEADADAQQALLKRYDHLQRSFQAMDGYQMEESFQRVVTGFSLTNLLDRPFDILSGGQKTVVRLATTVLKKPDILLLDEPTNHLDAKTLDWFEDFLRKYPGTVLIVSHDRWFLDAVATKTVFLAGGEAESYGGNYSYALKERERQLLIEFEQYKNQQKKVEAMREAIKRYRDWAGRSDNEKFYKKAKELEHRLERMDLMDRPDLDKKKLPIQFRGQRTGTEVLRIEDFTLSYGELILFMGAELLIRKGEKVALTGDNGTGKTALIRCVLGEERGYEGKITLSPSAAIGYIPQEIRFPDAQQTVVHFFQTEHALAEGEARRILAKFCFFGDHVFKRVGTLSGGEKVLIKLASLLQNEVNFLILDEPTNHIDIESRELLEQALSEYGGTLLTVSHDRYFIKKLADRRVRVHDGLLLSEK